MSQRAKRCPTPEQLDAYVRSGPASAASVAEHLQACASCQAAITAIRENNSFLERCGSRLRRAAQSYDAASLPEDAVPGYRLLREVSRGGQGLIYQAVQRSTDQVVAVKILRDGIFAVPRDRARFEREANVLARLDHPGIVTILDRGATKGHDFLVMRYVDGVPVDKWLNAQGALGDVFEAPTPTSGRRPPSRGNRERVERVVRLFADICDAVHAAHQRGVIHRDLKPGNVLVDAAGRPHVLDFGLAKLSQSPEALTSLSIETQTGHFLGSLPWASPEQAAGALDDIDVRTDVYALGVMLYQALTGQFPYDVTGPVRTVMDNITFAAPARPSSICRGLERDLETVVLKALSKKKARRYDSVAALRRDLLHFLAREAIDARRDSAWYVLQKAAQRHKLLLGAMAAVLVVAIGFAVQRGRHAASLEYALHLANIERGRSESRMGNLAVAEPILWREHLRPPASAFDETNHSTALDGRGTLATRWALWELYSRQPCVAAWHVGDSVKHVQFDVYGKLLLAGKDRLEVWTRLAPGQWRMSWQKAPALEGKPHFTPDGRWIIGATADGTIGAWDATSGKLDREWRASERAVPSLAIHPDGRSIATVDAQGVLRTWNLDTGEPLGLHRLESPSDAMQYSPDGKWLAVGVQARGLIRVLSSEGFTTVAELDVSPYVRGAGHAGSNIQDIAFSEDGAMIAAACYRYACVWRLPAFEQVAAHWHELPVNAVAFCVRHGWLATAGSETVRCWSLEDGSAMSAYAGHIRVVNGLACDPITDRLASVGEDGLLRVWEPRPAMAARVVELKDLHSLAFRHDGQMLACCGESETIQLLDPSNGRCIGKLPGPGEQLSSVDFSADGRRLAVGNYNVAVVRVFNLVDGSFEEFDATPGGASCVAFLPRSSELLIGDDNHGRVVLLDLASRSQRELANVPSRRIASLCAAANGDWLAWGGYGGDVHISHAGHPRSWSLDNHHAGTVRCVRASPDARWLASAGDDGRLRLWDVERRVIRADLAAHRGAVYGLGFSPDGRILASGGHDGIIRLWSVPAGRLLAGLEGPRHVISALAFSPDGRILGATSFGGPLVLWDLPYYDTHIAAHQRRFGHESTR